MARDYYDILGLSKSASDSEIKSSYRKLAMKYHPDRNPGDKKAEEKFKEISESYEILKDPQKKRPTISMGMPHFLKLVEVVRVVDFLVLVLAVFQIFLKICLAWVVTHEEDLLLQAQT